MFAVIHLPQFSLQAALRHEPDLWSKPVALVDPDSRNPLVREMTEPGRQAGVTPGLTPTQAMARCAQVLIRPRSLRQETAARNALLQCAYAFSPHLENTGPGLCTLDLRGLSCVDGADRETLQKWSEKLKAAMANVGFSVCVGLGKTPNIARLAAQWGEGTMIVEEPDRWIAALPVESLEPSSPVAGLLKRWGIRTVGELLVLGQNALIERLGLEALALLTAASSRTVRPLHLIQPTERFEESFEFETAIETLEPLLFLLRRFADQLSQRLEPRRLVAETLVLQLALESGEKQSLRLRLRLPQPTRQPDVLFRTLHTALESLRTDSPIQGVGLTVLPTAGEQKQLGLFETVLSDPQQFQETLARLSATLGPDRVGTPRLENTHKADAFHMTAPDFENAPVPVESRRSRAMHSTPIRRFRPALKIKVECEGAKEPAFAIISSAADTNAETGKAASDTNPSAGLGNRPVSIRSAFSNGKLKVIVGPSRSSGNWWQPDGWEREEWDAATNDGQVIRLVHQPDGWFLEGVID